MIKTGFLFFATALAEIIGCFLPYLWLRKECSLDLYHGDVRFAGSAMSCLRIFSHRFFLLIPRDSAVSPIRQEAIVRCNVSRRRPGGCQGYSLYWHPLKTGFSSQYRAHCVFPPLVA